MLDLDRTAISVSPPIAVVLKKLINQMAIGGHDLDAVEPRFFRVAGGGAVLLEQPAAEMYTRPLNFR